ncbi:MAG: DNA mismatch repair endonuclease MutL, partial [Clostridia bacterium]|nr:DNA mismatch repair endonuclease MutL [Clostridia bacterium]
MARIKQLPSEVAAMIAAGEVVDRPASVIKELVENAIDAGAKHIVAEIRQGGVKLIRVTDDGCGIAEEDVPVAFCRHATSKISVGEDLENIVTLGFRGEALYSIAAVAEVELVTKEAEQEIGVRAIVRAGEIEDIVPAGCPQGTTVMVRDLFFNTPARMKFLKRDATEAGYVEDTLRKIALGRPDISFRLIHNQKEIFFTPGDGCLQNAVAAFYGRDFADAMLPVSYKEDGVEVQGLIGKSELTRPNRTFQTFFVNGRCVMHKSFYVALAEAYKGQIMAGRFPVAVLSLHIHPGFCDVNVHPAKLEIKFAEDKPIFDAIYWGAKNSLYAIRDTRQLKVEPENKPEIMENMIPKAVSAKPAVRVPLYAENPCPIKEAAQTPLVENKPRIAKQTASISLTEENTWTKKPVCEESQTEKAVYSVATAPEPIQPFIPMPQAFD